MLSRNFTVWTKNKKNKRIIAPDRVSFAFNLLNRVTDTMCATDTVSVMCMYLSRCVSQDRVEWLHPIITHSLARSQQKEISIVKITYFLANNESVIKNEDIKLDLPRNCYHHWMYFSVWIWMWKNPIRLILLCIQCDCEKENVILLELNWIELILIEISFWLIPLP